MTLEEEYQRLYKLGLADRAIAGRTRTAPTKVHRWRKANNLPCHPRRKKQVSLNNPGMTMRIYSQEESEFLRAILTFRHKHKRPPSYVEGLHIALELGWRKE